MKKVLLSLIAILVLAVQVVQAEPICDVKNSLATGRTALLELLGTADKGAMAALKTKVEESSAAADAAVKSMTDNAATPADTKAKLTKFVETWTAFKETRQKEVFPAIEAGKVKEAKVVAEGVQAERVKAMGELIAAMGGDKCEPPKEEAKTK